MTDPAICWNESWDGKNAVMSAVENLSSPPPAKVGERQQRTAGLKLKAESGAGARPRRASAFSTLDNSRAAFPASG